MKTKATDEQLARLRAIADCADNSDLYPEEREAIRAALGELEWRRIGQSCLRSTLRSLREELQTRVIEQEEAGA